MKFLCDACGKKYATAEDPSPGKIYKLRCKACGHLIVVRAQAGSPGGGSTGAGPLPAEVASAIDGAAPSPTDAMVEPLAGPLAGPPAGLDELADFQAAAAEVLAAPSPGVGAERSGSPGPVGDGAAGEREGRRVDAFTSAARASLPDGYTGTGPLAPPRAEPSPPPRSTPRPSSPGRGPSPLLFIGLGVVLIGAVTLAAIFSAGKKPEPRPPAGITSPVPAPPLPPPREEPAPVVEQPGPAVEQRPEQRPEPKAEPPRAEPPRARPPDRRPEPKMPERRAEPKPEAKVEAKAEPRAEPPPPPPPVAAPPPVEARTEPREAPLPDAESALTPEVVQRVINANRRAFAGCIAAAGSDVKLDGRKVALKLTVNGNGAVTYPTLDDVTLNTTEMGQCLKSAARLMIFPKFKGDPFHAEVPLTLSN